jgi:hypothetical protein
MCPPGILQGNYSFKQNHSEEFIINHKLKICAMIFKIGQQKNPELIS